MPKDKLNRVFDARPDTLDFRDFMYVPSLIEVQPDLPVESYQEASVPILDQGKEGACTGFGLATVVNFLLRTLDRSPSRDEVSPYLLYHLARRYDEWPGEEYSGSSARGAMKGWHKHGVCSHELYQSDGRITGAVIEDCVKRPLGAYYRVNHRDIVAMHAAITEVGILYATAYVHSGWRNVTTDGQIHYETDRIGGHAFAIVAYDRTGFWIQNSWGPDWGKQGFCKISYDDWLVNGTDVWVARLGAAIQIVQPESTAKRFSTNGQVKTSLDYARLRPHVISLGNNGILRTGGTFGNTKPEVEYIINEQLPKITSDWPIVRILLYAHGGLVSEDSALQRIAEYRDPLLDNQVYPLSLIWKTDFWTTLTNIIQDAFSRRRPEGFLDAAKDFMLDRLDDGLEPVARSLGGLAQWSEMKENAIKASESSNGGARLAARLLARLIEENPKRFELHLVGHSAGSILLGALAALMAGKKDSKTNSGLGLKVDSVTLWAPAMTIEFFSKTFLPLIKGGAFKDFSLFTLTDQAEQDDHCANIYHKSLLYLVSNALEERQRIPLFRDGVPLLGMEKFIIQDQAISALIKNKKINWIKSPNAETSILRKAGAQHHGDFDDDPAVVRSTLSRILGKSAGEVGFGRTTAGKRDLRRKLEIQR